MNIFARTQLTQKSAEKRIFGKIGMVLIDMQDVKINGKSIISYNYGGLEKGIERVCQLINEAKKHNLAIINVKFLDFWQNFPQITASLKNYPYTATIIKEDRSACTQKEFNDFLEQEGIQSIIIAGYNRVMCVNDTIFDLFYRGFNIITSDELLFGNIITDKHVSLNNAIMKNIKNKTAYFTEICGIAELLNHIYK